ncbi:MAG: DUF4153 domain-containing protein [Candidatus Zixiibacteriota bacterium]
MKLKSFSLELLVSALRETVVRFPLPVLCSIIISTILVVLIEYSHITEDKYHLIQIVLSATLALPLLLAINATSETRALRTAVSWGAQVGVILLAILYFLILPDHISEPAMVRHSLLSLATISLLSFLPFSQGTLGNGYWQFNRSLVFRILNAVLFVGVLFAGLAIAILAGNELFDLGIDGKRYGQLWVILSCFVGPMFVLAGIPKPLISLEEHHDYPKALKAFAQYILLPLVGLYLVILYLYEIKIVAQWNWPRGWVSLLILWYSAVGMASILILWPLRNIEGNRWVKRFTTWFFYLLIPLVAMLFLAIKVRIGDYGLTVNRYLVVALAVWLTLIVLYFIFSKAKDIRAIPIVVIIVALVASYGPLSAWSVSEKSQLARLTAFLEKQKAVATLALDSKEKSEIRGEMSSIIEYLTRWHGVESLTGVVPDSVLAKSRDSLSQDGLEEMCLSLGFSYISRWEPRGSSGNFNLSTTANSLIYLSDHSYLLTCNFSQFEGTTTQDDVRKFKGVHSSDTCLAILSSDSRSLQVEVASLAFAGRDSLVFDIVSELEARELLVNAKELTADSTQFIANGKYVTGRFVASRISGEDEDGKPKINWMSGYLIIERK